MAADSLTKEQRSILMSKVRNADTLPEWILRSALHRRGFRYRLHGKDLPGRPDLVFPRYRVVVFIHGCFWHRHSGCKDASSPKTNQIFWEQKFSDNVKRDQAVSEALIPDGWEVVVVWECELMRQTMETIDKVCAALVQRGALVSQAGYDRAKLSKRDLLAIAEKKARYRSRVNQGKRA